MRSHAKFNQSEGDAPVVMIRFWIRTSARLACPPPPPFADHHQCIEITINPARLSRVSKLETWVRVSTKGNGRTSVFRGVARNSGRSLIAVLLVQTLHGHRITDLMLKRRAVESCKRVILDFTGLDRPPDPGIILDSFYDQRRPYSLFFLVQKFSYHHCDERQCSFASFLQSPWGLLCWSCVLLGSLTTRTLQSSGAAQRRKQIVAQGIPAVRDTGQQLCALLDFNS